jgi:hypothetical protein
LQVHSGAQLRRRRIEEVSPEEPGGRRRLGQIDALRLDRKHRNIAQKEGFTGYSFYRAVPKAGQSELAARWVGVHTQNILTAFSNPKGRSFDSPASALYWPAEDLRPEFWLGFRYEIAASTILFRFLIAIINLYLSDDMKNSQRLTRIAEYALS